MDITEFFRQSAGKWFSQRTNHYFALNQSESGKFNIVIEMIPNDDLLLVKLYEQHKIDPAQALRAVRITWDGTMERGDRKDTGSTILVPVADPYNPHEGKLLCETSYAETAPVAGRYVMGGDDALTLITESETLYAEERLWFASPNLRMRTSTLKRLDGFSMASFCSEIRMGGKQPPASSVAATEANS
ncbi:MAG TPA: phycobiliprotein lyase [Coleofasciculaceae cyanobacterium]